MSISDYQVEARVDELLSFVKSSKAIREVDGLPFPTDFGPLDWLRGFEALQ